MKYERNALYVGTLNATEVYLLYNIFYDEHMEVSSSG